MRVAPHAVEIHESTLAFVGFQPVVHRHSSGISRDLCHLTRLPGIRLRMFSIKQKQVFQSQSIEKNDKINVKSYMRGIK